MHVLLVKIVREWKITFPVLALVGNCALVESISKFPIPSSERNGLSPCNGLFFFLLVENEAFLLTRETVKLALSSTVSLIFGRVLKYARTFANSGCTCGTQIIMMFTGA